MGLFIRRLFKNRLYMFTEGSYTESIGDIQGLPREYIDICIYKIMQCVCS